jgi:hypothetical protein
MTVLAVLPVSAVQVRPCRRLRRREIWRCGLVELSSQRRAAPLPATRRLTVPQRAAALHLLQVLLSPKGYQKVLDIMGSDQSAILDAIRDETIFRGRTVSERLCDEARSTLVQQEKAIQRENFVGCIFSSLSGFPATKFHILKPRWLATTASDIRGQGR